MSSLETRKIEPLSGTTVTLGEAGDTVAVPTGAIVKTNTVKDSGGNTLFTSDGAGTLSSVNSAFEGSMIFISSQTAAGTQYIDFTTGIDDTYDEYVFYFVNLHPAAAGYDFQFQMRKVGDTGSSPTDFDVTMTTSTSRAYHTEANASALQYEASWDQAQTEYYQNLGPQILADNDASCSGELHIYNPSNTTVIKHFWARVNVMANNPANPTSTDAFSAGFFNTAEALDAISFRMNNSAAPIDDGTIYLYGVL